MSRLSSDPSPVAETDSAPQAWDRTIGVVAAPFGLDGELRTRIVTDFPERFVSLTRVALRHRESGVTVAEVKRVRMHRGCALLKVVGVDTIDDAEQWRGADVCVERDDVVELPADSYYSADLVGMTVVTDDGREIGEVQDVLRYPAQDLLVVGDALIPAVKAIVRRVDTLAKRITITPPDGMLP